MEEARRTYLVVSYGASSADVEGAILERHPNSQVRRAFTSRAKARRERVEHVSTVFQKLSEEGVTHVTVQPLDVINGSEFEILRDEVMGSLDLFEDVRLGTPLLTSERDCRSVCFAVSKDILPEIRGSECESSYVVLVARGSEHYANASLCQLQEMLYLDVDERTAVTTVEGFPSYLDTAKRLHRMGAVSISVVPFIVDLSAADREEIAGKDELSLLSTLSSEGFKVKCFMKGLGARPAFQRLFADHADAAAILKRSR